MVVPTTSSLETVTDTPHPIASSTNDVTVAPTLNTTEKEVYMLAQLEDNGKCNLPCWWGIIPGFANWLDVSMEYAQRGFESSQLPNGNTFGIGGFDLTSISTYTEIVFTVKQNTVQNISISATGALKPLEFQKAWEYYSPDKILTKYGQPSRIWLDVSTYGNSNKAGYEYWLYYDNLGFLIIYGGSSQMKTNLNICPSFVYGENIQEIHLYLKGSNDLSSLETLVGNDFIQTRSRQLKTFEEAAGKPISKYFDNFLANQKNICFDTPRNIWP